MPDFSNFPRALAERAQTRRFGDVPVLLAHPDWKTPTPTVLWFHGRTASKELDPGRYLRWIRAGVAACAVDLPGHGERFDPDLNTPSRTPEIIAQATREIDSLVEALADPSWGGLFDLDRLGIGGMSAGGMTTLRRLCDSHSFKCAAVEGTTGWLDALYFPQKHPETRGITPWPSTHDPLVVEAVDPLPHLSGFHPIPLLALHSEKDTMVPIAGQRAFVERLRAHYRRLGADPALITFHTWAETGAPNEHIGFGRVSNEAKTLQTQFLAEHLRAAPPAVPF